MTALLPLPGQAGNDTVVVVMDQARVVKVPDNTTTLVVGNPGIADVALLKNNNTMIITGKGFSETNMTVCYTHRGVYKRQAWNLALSFVPVDLTAAIITTLMRPAMRPYSIAVAPD